MLRLMRSFSVFSEGGVGAGLTLLSKGTFLREESWLAPGGSCDEVLRLSSMGFATSTTPWPLKNLFCQRLGLYTAAAAVSSLAVETRTVGASLWESAPGWEPTTSIGCFTLWGDDMTRTFFTGEATNHFPPARSSATMGRREGEGDRDRDRSMMRAWARAAFSSLFSILSSSKEGIILVPNITSLVDSRGREAASGERQARLRGTIFHTSFFICTALPSSGSSSSCCSSCCDACVEMESTEWSSLTKYSGRYCSADFSCWSLSSFVDERR
mmetsp:Transcript_28705/g.53416  ORF Transcript_28705/g.53416 Transcript_28705/m.53416 type:complete len:270 (-) Transcript_28705:1050-1859(-)